jgi:arylsulfatase A-like enzyme
MLVMASAACDREPRPSARVDVLEALPRATFSEELRRELSDRAGDASGTIASGGSWTARDGEVREESLIVDGSDLPRLVRLDPRLADGRVAAEVWLVPGSRGVSTGGVLARLRDENDGIGLLLQEGVGVTLMRLQEGRARVLAHRPAPIQDGRWYRVALSVAGRRCTAFVDDALVLTADVPDLPAEGGIGMFRGRGEGIAVRDFAIDRGGGVERVSMDVRRASPLLDPLLARNGHADKTPVGPLLLRRVVDVHDDYRDCLVVPPGSEVRVPVPIGANARLAYDVGVMDVPGAGSGSAARFEVGQDVDHILQFHHLSGAVQARQWQAVETPLEPGTSIWFRNQRIGAAPGLFAAVCNPAIEPVRDESAGPNLVLVTVDTLRADHLGAYGYDRATSPFIDALTREAVVFDSVIAQSSWTKTSMASMLTSTYPETNGVRATDEQLPRELVTLTEALRRAGYFTIGVQTNPWVHPRFNLAAGFAEYHLLPGPPSAATVHQVAIDALRRRGRSPVFVYLHYMDVHHPYDPPPSYRTFGERPQDLYDGALRYLDDQLAEFHATLERLGMLENTIFVVTSDHGEEFGEHGGRYHGTTLHREQIEVPWIVSWRKRVPVGRRPGAVRNLDVAPTLLDLVGVTPPTTFQGRSLRRRILEPGGDAEASPPWFSQVGLNEGARDRDLLAVGAEGWRYMMDRRSDWQALYDAAKDPAERDDRSAERPDVTSRLRTLCQDYVARHVPTKPVDAIPLDPSLAERLRKLGYLVVAEPALAP